MPKQTKAVPFPWQTAQDKTTENIKEVSLEQSITSVIRSPHISSVFQAMLLLKEFCSGVSAFLMRCKHPGWGPNLVSKQVNPAFEQNLLTLRTQNKPCCSLYARLLLINLGLTWSYSKWSHMEWLCTDFRGLWIRLAVPKIKPISSWADREEAWLHNS